MNMILKLLKTCENVDIHYFLRGQIHNTVRINIYLS